MGKKLEPRVRTNYGCLRWAFQSLIASLNESDGNSGVNDELLKKMDAALSMALDKHKALTKELKDKIPKGNIAACILCGYEQKAFNLAKKPEKLVKHDGIIWEDDLCLRPEALIRFVRLQPGYHNWSRNHITQSLKDIGALVIQEENAATVHLDKDLPRVYRIRLDVLKDEAKYYKGGKP